MVAVVSIPDLREEGFEDGNIVRTSASYCPAASCLTTAVSSRLKPPLPNQAGPYRRDLRLALTQRIGAGVHRIAAEDEIVIVRDGGPNDQLGISHGHQLDRLLRR